MNVTQTNVEGDNIHIGRDEHQTQQEQAAQVVAMAVALDALIGQLRVDTAAKLFREQQVEHVRVHLVEIEHAYKNIQWDGTPVGASDE